jgi:energy-coupling factor transporter ATP-binding protein EcfA2
MFIPEELVDIIKRIGSCTHTESDLQRLGQLFGATVAAGTRSISINREANGATLVTGDGNTILNITFQADGLRIGDKDYEGGGAELLRSLLQTILQPNIEIDWSQVSRTILEERFQLTTNPTTKGENIFHRVEQMYVPLGLVERKKLPRRKRDVLPEKGSDLYREGCEQENFPLKTEILEKVEVTRKFEYEQFLEQVLQHSQNSKFQGKKIAIIGEPGAGKTTLLQQIARWVSETFPQSIVIWVSFAALQGDTLETYLEKRWIQNVTRIIGRAEASNIDRNDFASQFQKGRVWLLLDGLDEMQVAGNPLSEIQRQIQEGGWLQQARIILTCRLNLWDGNRNSLDRFETYRTLDFAYPNQVEQFIEKWFAPLEKDALDRSLCSALKESGRERIRDLVKNPLRLTLLCFNWYLQQGNLPNTQAELYQRFVDLFYEWKQEDFPTTQKQRNQINHALAELSRAAIDDADPQKQGRFRLRHDFINDFLKESVVDSEETLFSLALKVGWLNQIGVDADNLTQTVYAFYHPTFEEYFAALGIDNGSFFLNTVDRNPMAKEAIYRVFETEWRQVFLLWLGRNDTVLKQKKEDLIKSLMTFKDDCGGFYSDRAFLLAVVGISEFKDCNQADKIISLLVQYKYGDDLSNQSKHDNSSNQKKISKKLLEKKTYLQARKYWVESGFPSTNTQRLILELITFMQAQRSWAIRKSIVDLLSKIGVDNAIVIKEMVKVLMTEIDKSTLLIAANFLLSTNSDKKILKKTIIENLISVHNQNKSSFINTAWVFTKLAPNKKDAVQWLFELLEIAPNKYTFIDLAGIIITIDPENEVVTKILTNLLKTSQDYYACYNTIRILHKTNIADKVIIQAVKRLSKITQSKYDLIELLLIIGYIDSRKENAAQVIVDLLKITEDTSFRYSLFSSLGKICKGNKIAIQSLVNELETSTNFSLRQNITNILINTGVGDELMIRLLQDLQETTHDEIFEEEITKILMIITIKNNIHIDITPEVIEKITSDILLNTPLNRRFISFPGGRCEVILFKQDCESTSQEKSEFARFSPNRSSTLSDNNDDKLVNNKRLESLYGEKIYLFVSLIDTTTLDNLKNIFLCERAIQSLNREVLDSRVIIESLAKLISKIQIEHIYHRELYEAIVKFLCEASPGNGMVVELIASMLENCPDNIIQEILIGVLVSIGNGNKVAVTALIKLLEAHQHKLVHRKMRNRENVFTEIFEDNINTSINIVTHILTCQKILDGLVEISCGDEDIIRLMINSYEISQSAIDRERVTNCLSKIDLSSEEEIKKLLSFMKHSKSDFVRESIMQILLKPDLIEKTFAMFDMETLRSLLRYMRPYLHLIEGCKIMMKCSEIIPYREFYQIYHLS